MKSYITSDCSTPRTNSYECWSYLVSKISEIANAFEIRCWSGDVSGLETGIKYGQKMENNESDEIVYEGYITKEFISDILNNNLTKDKTLKWFSIFFKKDGEILFSSEHYGTTLILIGISQGDADEIIEFSEQFDEVKKVNIWNS